MFNAIVAALSATLLVQSPSTLTARLTPEQAADIARLMPDAAPTMSMLGACERLMPELSQHLAPMFNSPTDTADQAAFQEYMRQAYERGKTSPESETVTPEACVAAAADLQAQTKQLQQAQAEAEASELTPKQQAQADRAMALVMRMIENLGSCEAVMPDGTAEQIRAGFNKGDDPEARRLLLEAYERGKASPAAAGRTMDSCMADLTAIAEELQSLQTEMEADLNAD
ncbi:hypothetical protein [uncultured Brevundimonas sp.]|uniref:hypothetical protein n=1 Tax=uncultured Brevundimonas sp. TaxID=213418 RepID=UPI000FC3A1BB|nr:hypothetical protein [uncultured Brevundimonas sp.]